MDELKLSSKFMKGVISKIVKAMIKKNFGCDVNVSIEDFGITFADGKAHVHLNADAEMNGNEITKFLTTMGIG